MESDLTNNPSPTIDIKPIAKQPTFLVTLLSILLIISCLIAGFFAYQTQNLVKELTKLKTYPTPTTTAIPISDSTLNWRSYTNKKLGFSFKLSPIFTYPENIISSESNMFSNRKDINSPLELSPEDVLLESTVYTNIDESSLQKVNIALASEIQNITKQPFQPIGSIKKVGDLENGGSIFEESPADSKDVTYYISIWQNNGNVHVLKMFGLANIVTNHKDTFKLMSETYDFIKADDQVACTYDAKICPDGSAVGRTAPNCEFAPCPTTSPQPQLSVF